MSEVHPGVSPTSSSSFRRASSTGVLSDKPIWDRDGRDWPNHDASRFVHAGGLRWHVQQMGQGPAALLLHGTGAATHSWRGLAPLLAERFTVVAPDLPGHGFTEAPGDAGLSLPGMARLLDALLTELDLRPAVGIGHSAGAAILLRMTLDDLIAPKLIVSLNGALLPFRGFAGQIFAPIAKLLFANWLVPRLFAWRAGDRATVERLLRDTGSTLEPEGVELYRRLAGSPGHVAAALGMMANWDLETLERDLPRLQTPLLLVVGDRDGTVPPSEADLVRARLPSATIETLPGLGHLAHEERPDLVANLVVQAARAAGGLPRARPARRKRSAP
jgi:magnesium chelatase accessory protein